MKKYILIIISVLSIIACSNNNDLVKQVELVEPIAFQGDKIIFGLIYDMCSGDCRDLYLIHNKSLYRDADNRSDLYGELSNTTFEEKMDQEEFNKVKDLLNVPSSLLQQDSSEELIVDIKADVDYYLYIEIDGKSKELILDDIHKNANPEIKAYFKTFLKIYKELDGYMIDTSNYYD
jgi:hypothetical protein